MAASSAKTVTLSTHYGHESIAHCANQTQIPGTS